MKKLIVGFILVLSEISFAKCIPPYEYVPFEGKAARPNRDGYVTLGNYARISPDGRYVLRSFSGDHLSSVTLMELRKSENGQKTALAHETDFNNEAFPVQGSWRFLVDLDGSHYKVSDLLRDGKDAKKQFRGGVTGFYTTAAEMKSSNGEIKIRSLSWPNQHSNNGDQGVGELFNKILTVKQDGSGKYKVVKEEGAFRMCRNLRSSEGSIYSLPMIAPGGEEFAAMPQNPKGSKPSIRIYKFGANNEDCQLVENLDVPASKVIFGFPQKEGGKAPLAFFSSGYQGHRPVTGMHYYDRDLKKIFFISDTSKELSADSFPGMTKDGRVIYGAKWRDCVGSQCKEKTGYIIADPYQSADMKAFKAQNPAAAKNLKQCITEEEVRETERVQDEFYGLKREMPSESKGGAR